MAARALATGGGGGTLAGMGGEDTVRDEVRIGRRTNASGVFGRSKVFGRLYKLGVIQR